MCACRHSPDSLRQVDLGYRDPVITFQFAALDFTGPSNVRYSYRLEGFDPDWVDAGNARQATYTRLECGRLRLSCARSR